MTGQPTRWELLPTDDDIRRSMSAAGATIAPYVAAATAAMQALGRAYTELAEHLRAAGILATPATRGSASPRTPSYRDDRPRHESPYGPPRRHR